MSDYSNSQLLRYMKARMSADDLRTLYLYLDDQPGLKGVRLKRNGSIEHDVIEVLEFCEQRDKTQVLVDLLQADFEHVLAGVQPANQPPAPTPQPTPTPPPVAQPAAPQTASNLDALYEELEAAVDDDDWDTVIGLAKKIIRLDAGYQQKNVHFHLAQGYQNTTRLELAVAEYTKVLELDPDDSTAYNNRGLAYLAAGGGAG